ncbi:MAG: hypothetical protein IPP17_25090 [Bacteroidetes bacterium]|nr:hypothetical protein [Bacteroidota bacterium]
MNGSNIDNLGNHSASSSVRSLVYWRQRWDVNPDFRLQVEKWVRVAMLELLPTHSIDRCKRGDLVVRLTVLSGTLQTKQRSVPAGCQQVGADNKGNIEVSDPENCFQAILMGSKCRTPTWVSFSSFPCLESFQV